MQSTKDWTQIEDDDEDEEYEVEDTQQDQPQNTQEQKTLQNEDPNVHKESSYHHGERNTEYYRDRGQRGQRRGGRGGRGGNRDDRNSRREKDQQEFINKPKAPMESQPKHEMINLINRARNDIILITIFNVDYKSSEDNIKESYSDVKFRNIKQPKAGVFVLEFDKENALKFIDIGTKTFNGREFYMKLSYEQPENNNDFYQQGNTGRKYEQGGRYYEERDRRGDRGDRGGRGGRGGHKGRRDHDDYEKKGNQHRNQPFQREQNNPPQIEPENKFFKGHDLNANAPMIRFTNSAHAALKKEDSTHESNQPKVTKPNPFGGAVPRDENDYLKRKEEEKKVEEIQKKPVEEKKAVEKIEQSTRSQTAKPENEEGRKHISEPLVLERHQSEKVDRDSEKFKEKGHIEEERPKEKRYDRKYEKHEKYERYENTGKAHYNDNNYKQNRQPNKYTKDKYFDELSNEYGNEGNYPKQEKHENYEKYEKHERYEKGGRNPLAISHHRSEGGAKKYGGGGYKNKEGGYGNGGGGYKNKEAGYGNGGGYDIVYEIKPKEKQAEIKYEKEPQQQKQFESKRSFKEGERGDYSKGDSQKGKESSNKFNRFTVLE